MEFISGKGRFPYGFGGSDSVSPGMDKNDNLLRSYPLNDFFIQYLINHHHFSDSFFLSDAYVDLFQRDRTIRLIKIKKTLSGIDAKSQGDIFVVGECGGQANNSDLFMGRLNLTNGSCDERLKNRPSGVGKQMDFVDDEEFDFLSESPLSGLPGNDIPFFRGRDDNLSLINLGFGQMHIPSQLFDIDIQRLQFV